MFVRSILRPFVTFYGRLVYFWSSWYIFARFGMLYQVKSGNPGSRSFTLCIPACRKRQNGHFLVLDLPKKAYYAKLKASAVFLRLSKKFKFFETRNSKNLRHL
jgi:hypothetical protein